MRRRGWSVILWLMALWALALAPCKAQERGIIVESVTAGSAAAKAGLQVGDRLLRVDNKPLPTPFTLKAWFANAFDKKEVVVSLQRGGRAMTVTVPVGTLGVTTRPDLADAALQAYESGLSPNQSPAQTIAAWKKAAEVAQAGGDIPGAAWLWWTLGQYEGGRRLWQEAQASYTAAWALVKSGADAAAQYLILAELGECSDELGDAVASRSWLERSAQTAETGRLPGWQANAFNNLGVLAFIHRDLQGALDGFQRALAIREKLAPESLDVAASLNNLGVVASSRGDLTKAEEYYRRALALREKLAPGSLDVASSLYSLGNVARIRGDLAQAEDYYHRTLALREKLAPNSQDVADCLNNLGLVADSRGDLNHAEDYYHRALTLFEKLAPGSLNVARILSNLGVVASSRGDLTQALDYHHRALDIRKKLAPGSRDVAASLNNLGLVASKQGDMARASDYYSQALTLFEKLAPVSLDMATSLNNLGTVASKRGDLAQASDYYQRALDIQEKLAPDSRDVARSLNNLGNMAYSRGDLDHAEDYHHRALALFEKLAPGSLDVATSLDNLGNVVDSRGDLAQASDYHHRALILREKLAPNSRDVAYSLNNLGLVASKQGDLAQASDYYHRALAIQEKLAPGSLDVAYSLDNLGLVASSRGDLAQAENYYQRALAIEEKLAPNSLDVAGSLNNLGLVADSRGNLTQAENYYHRALTLYEKLAPGSLAVADSLNNLGNVVDSRGDLGHAEEYHHRALTLREKLAPNSRDVATSLSNLGFVASERGDLAQAEEYRHRALTLFEKLAPDSLEVATSLNNLAYSFRQDKRPQDATPLLLRAVAIIEKQRGHIESPDARALLAQQYSNSYDDLILAYLDLNDPGNAFATLEHSRARALADQIAERGLDFSHDAPKPLLDKQRDLDNQRRIAYKQRTRLDPDKDKTKLAANDARLTELTVQQEELTALIRRQSPRYAALVYPQPLDTAAVQQTLEPGVLLLAYSVQKDQTLLFALTRTSLDFYRIPVAQDALSQSVHQLRALLSQSGSTDDDRYRPLARKLYDSLLRPASKQIAAAQRLLVCPDGPLHTLPFCALIETLPAGSSPKERFLVEAKPLHTVVSLTVYQQLKKLPTGPNATTLLAYGDPRYPQDIAQITPMQAAFIKMGRKLGPLPQTAGQVTTIGALFAPHSLLRLNKAATTADVLAEGGKARILHFACHGLLDDGEPLASALALTPEGKGDDGMLRAYDIMTKLHLHADLVVLAGCETGLGQESKSEGIIGLTRAFEYAGARSIAVSLWEIADTSSTALMEAFYRNLKAGKPKDEALRAAQLALLHGKKADWRDPFHWAAFQLVGDWK